MIRPQEQNKAYVRHAHTVACSGSMFGSILSRSPSRTKTHVNIAVTNNLDLNDLWQTSRATKQG